MNLKNIRNVAVIVGIVAVLLGMIWLVSSFLSAIVPLTITAVVAFVLGRMSTRMNLLQTAGRLFDRTAISATPEQKAAAKVEKVERTEEVATYAASLVQTRAAEKLAEKPAPPAPDTTRLVENDDPVELPPEIIKSEEQLRAESKRIEEEVAQRATGYDPKAAIEERKKRLLGKTE